MNGPARARGTTRGDEVGPSLNPAQGTSPPRQSPDRHRGSMTGWAGSLAREEVRRSLGRKKAAGKRTSSRRTPRACTNRWRRASTSSSARPIGPSPHISPGRYSAYLRTLAASRGSGEPGEERNLDAESCGCLLFFSVMATISDRLPVLTGGPHVPVPLET